MLPRASKATKKQPAHATESENRCRRSEARRRASRCADTQGWAALAQALGRAVRGQPSAADSALERNHAWQAGARAVGVARPSRCPLKCPPGAEAASARRSVAPRRLRRSPRKRTQSPTQEGPCRARKPVRRRLADARRHASCRVRATGTVPQRGRSAPDADVDSIVPKSASTTRAETGCAGAQGQART